MAFGKAEILVKRSKVVLETILKHFPNSAFVDVSLKKELRKEIEGLLCDLIDYQPKPPKKSTYKKKPGTRAYPQTGKGIPTAADVRRMQAEDRADELLDIKKEA